MLVSIGVENILGVPFRLNSRLTLMNTVFPSVSAAKFSGVSSMADDDAAKARTKDNCLSIVDITCCAIDGAVYLLWR